MINWGLRGLRTHKNCLMLHINYMMSLYSRWITTHQVVSLGMPTGQRQGAVAVVDCIIFCSHIFVLVSVEDRL